MLEPEEITKLPEKDVDVPKSVILEVKLPVYSEQSPLRLVSSTSLRLVALVPELDELEQPKSPVERDKPKSINNFINPSYI